MSGLGLISDIDIKPVGDSSMTIAGQFGAAVIDNQGLPVREVFFEERTPGGFRVSAKIVPDAVSGEAAFLRVSGSAATGDRLVNGKGRVLWETDWSPASAGFGDVDGDGAIELAFAGHQGLELRNLKGQVRDRILKGQLLWDVALVDADGDGKDEVFTSGGGKLAIWKSGGAMEEVAPPVPGHFSDFVVAHWGAKDAVRLVSSSDQGLIVLSSDGRERVGSCQLPYISLKEAVYFYPMEEKEMFLAVVGDMTRQGDKEVGFTEVEGILGICDSTGNLVWMEKAAAGFGTVARSSNSNAVGDELLVGGEGMVWRYSVMRERGGL